jgi:hypothetical protein
MSGSSARRLASIILGAFLTLALVPAGALAAPILAATAPAITSGTSTTFTVGAAGTFTVTTTGTPTSAISETGSLPGGVTLVDNHDGTATLTGAPAAATNGSYPITITANNGTAPNATQNFTLTVNESPNITSAAATTFTVGMAGTFTVTTTGTPTPAITETGPLPGAVTFADNHDGTATLAGTPAAATNGTYPIAITANNGVPSNAVQNFTLTVNPATAPNFTSGTSTTFSVGVAGTFSVTATGLPFPAITATGSLPGGVTFVDNRDGSATLAGTPAASGTYPITITAANGTTNAVQNFTLTVNPGVAAHFTSASSTAFTVGTAGTFTVATSGGTPTPAISITAGSLPGGVTLTDNGNGTATLAGTPAASDTYPITITASNVAGSPTQSFTLTVNAAAAPTITSVNQATFTEGTFGTFTVTTTGTPVPAITETGSLPSSLSFVDNGNGTATISGTPVAGSSLSSPYTISIRASNVAGNPTQAFFLTVNAGANRLLFLTQPGGGAAGAAWTQQPVVEVVDSLNQVVTADNSTVVYLGIGTNPAGGALSCSSGTSATVVNGIATFSGCSIDMASSSYYTLSATSSTSDTPAASVGFYIGGSETLQFLTQPGGGPAGTVWTQQPVVEVLNSPNQVVTTDSSTVVSLSIATNPAGGTLSCTSGTSATVVNGVATFSGCSIDIASSNPYTLSASSSPSWTPAISGVLYVTGAATPVMLTGASAVGASPGTATFSTSTKLLKVGQSITIRVESNPQLAGAKLGVWIAVKGSNGTWGAYRPHASVTTDASGTAYYTYTIGSKAWLAFRFYYAGSGSMAPAWSYPSQFGRAL